MDARPASFSRSIGGGCLAAVALCAGMAIAHQATARDLTGADLRRIERINQDWNGRLYSVRLQRSDPACSIYAVNKAYDLVRRGFGAGEVVIAVVTTESGQLHAVAEVRGVLKGKPITIVLDNRHEWTASRDDLEAAGYTWNTEFTR